MRKIDHHAEAVHFRDDPAAQRRKSVVVEIALRFAGIGIGELAVAVMRERHVTPAAIIELLDTLQVEADGIAILNADDGGALACFMQSDDIGGREGKAI